MAVTANTNETYNESIIKEDLSDALTSISPTECPFMASVGTRDISNTYFEWAEVEGESTQSIHDQMPMNTWCFVKSYEFNIGGVWKLVKIQ